MVNHWIIFSVLSLNKDVFETHNYANRLNSVNNLSLWSICEPRMTRMHVTVTACYSLVFIHRQMESHNATLLYPECNILCQGKKKTKTLFPVLKEKKLHHMLSFLPCLPSLSLVFHGLFLSEVFVLPLQSLIVTEVFCTTSFT